MSTAFAAPVVATHGETSSDAPLVVLLHGRGSNEQGIISLAPHLPSDVAWPSSATHSPPP